MRKKKGWSSWLHERNKVRAKQTPNGDCTLAIFLSDEFQKPIYAETTKMRIAELERSVARRLSNVQTDMNSIAKLYKKVDLEMIEVKKIRQQIMELESVLELELEYGLNV